MGLKERWNAFADWLDGTVGDDEYRQHLGSSRWQRTRAALIAREALDQGRAQPLCRRCRTNLGTDVHHKTYDRFGKEKLSDLELVCKRCHGTIHGNGRA